MRGALSLEFLQIFAAMMLIAAMLFGVYTATAGQLMGYSAQMFGSAAISKLAKDINFVCVYPQSERIVDLQMRNAKVTLILDRDAKQITVRTGPKKEETYATYCEAYFADDTKKDEASKDTEKEIAGDVTLKINTAKDGINVLISK